MQNDNLQNIINAMTSNQMTSYTAGPIYSSWLFRVNSTVINLVSRFVSFPDGSGVEHETWEDTITPEVKEQLHNWLGVRNNIIDAINDLEGGFPPSSFDDTYTYLVQSASNVNESQLKQMFAKEYIRRQQAGEKMHSTIKQYVEDHVTATIKGNETLIDVKDTVLNYLYKEESAKTKDASAVSYSNLPEWFDDMVFTVFESKFSEMYSKKQVMLDRRLSPSTRQAIETELYLMIETAKQVGVEIKPVENTDFDQNAYLSSLGLNPSAI